MATRRRATGIVLVGLGGVATAACAGEPATRASGHGDTDTEVSPDSTPDAGDSGEPSLEDASVAEDAGSPWLSKNDNRHLWAKFCENQPDQATLPPDPRTLVQPGVNEGKAVLFNAHWKDCGNATPLPTTCGDYRSQVEQGFLIGEGQGQVGTAHMFGASYPESFWTVPASNYNNMWQVWGLAERPANFDELVAERHGSPPTPFRNPYPLPGENPNETHGGSGQLPLVYTQLRNEDGTWTGNIGIKLCAFCHNGALDMDGPGADLGTNFGGAGSIGDFHVAFRDFAGTGVLPYSAFSLVNVATNRGTGAIDQFQLGFILFANGDPGSLPVDELLNSSAIGTIKSPPWWNLANRPQKFHGAVLPTDSSRIDMAAYYPVLPSVLGGQGAADAVTWADANAVPFQLWAESLPSPAFPGPVDEDLAEVGAVLFHTANLWDESRANPVAKPEGGNGSCASCHGVYSDYYANDPNFLDSPELKGIAARLVPMTIMDTDPVYTSAGQSLKDEEGNVNPAMLKNPMLYCGFGAVGETLEARMLAPPLYGIWASAPYLHNGSVPNIWGILDPSSDRPRMWKRVSRAKPSGQDVVMGYDTDVQRAYDFAKLGWKYEDVQCGDPGTNPGQDCVENSPDTAPPRGEQWDALYQNFWLAWNLPLESRPPLSNQEIEDRKVYNTWRYSQSNSGHAFTAVLSHDERVAIIEYLKTL